MHFGENQLSRSLIGLSPLPTTHPPGFQPWWVRASTTSYSRFTLAMGRSLRFGSTPRNSTISKDGNALFGLAFATATPPGLTSPRSITRRLILQKARHHHHTPTPRKGQRCSHGSDGLHAHGFRYAFTPLPGYFSSFPHGTI